MQHFCYHLRYTLGFALSHSAALERDFGIDGAVCLTSWYDMETSGHGTMQFSLTSTPGTVWRLMVTGPCSFH